MVTINYSNKNIRNKNPSLPVNYCVGFVLQIKSKPLYSSFTLHLRGIFHLVHCPRGSSQCKQTRDGGAKTQTVWCNPEFMHLQDCEEDTEPCVPGGGKSSRTQISHGRPSCCGNINTERGAERQESLKKEKKGSSLLIWLRQRRNESSCGAPLNDFPFPHRCEGQLR
ncbi:unnamed protein product [Pleuronectes platessa]|uniref:Uncharacterized protein n=1 Tax=Pleuronectes platessa TaxID=8262 RepID=A0A9N7YNC7_PLEPL|nr:unnamed protein product [Pleuronectes platessa]